MTKEERSKRLNKILEIYKSEEISFNEHTYRLGYNTSKARKAANLIYKNANIFLDRKYKRYVYDTICHT